MSTDILTSTFLRLRARLRGMAAGIAGNSDADDILHDAFCRLWLRNSDVRTEVEAMKLSYTAVRNSAIDVRRRTAAHGMMSIDDECCQLRDCAWYDQPEADSMATYRTVVELARRRLPERQFAVFRMHDIDGIGYEEIAVTLSITQENVRMTLSRARKTLRELSRKSYQ